MRWTALLVFLWKVIFCYGCGKVLEPEFNGTDATIVYQPPADLEDLFRDKYNKNGGFRFVFKPNGGNSDIVVYLRQDHYHLDGFTLRIVGVRERDEGSYYAQCFNGPPEKTNSVTLDLHVLSSTSTLTTTLKTTLKTTTLSFGSVSLDTGPEGLSHRDIVMIVVALCAVLIVLIVMLSLVAIFRYRRRSTDGGTTLVSKDGASFGQANDVSDIYNEINPAECQPGTSKPESSPMISRNKVLNAPRGTVKIRTEYAQINEAQMLSESELVTIKGSNGASVNGDSRYKVDFPTINCDTLTKQLYENGDFARDNLYAKPLKRSEKRKSRMKSLELKYITMDLPPGDEEDHHYDAAPPVDKGNLTLEYAEIDFQKSNFKAPLRKAPSSWYLRKNRKKR